MVNYKGRNHFLKNICVFGKISEKRAKKSQKGAQMIFSIFWWGKLIRGQENFLGGTNPGGNYGYLSKVRYTEYIQIEDFLSFVHFLTVNNRALVLFTF